jgi:hypothetical protein
VWPGGTWFAGWSGCWHCSRCPRNGGCHGVEGHLFWEYSEVMQVLFVCNALFVVVLISWTVSGGVRLLGGVLFVCLC